MGCLRNIVLTLAYDGTHYKGWQNGKSHPSIEASLELALRKVLTFDGKLQAASRTDAGVHAKGQVVNFYTTSHIPINGIKMRLNNLLPSDISVLDVSEAHIDFHPTLDCSAKEYHYYVCNSSVQLPQNRLYSWHFPYKLNFENMQRAVSLLTGSLNFQSFTNVRKNHVYDEYIREVMYIEIVALPEQRICFKIKGNKFLFKMVRNLVGTLLSIGSHKMTLDDLSLAISSKDRTRIGLTAKAHGLTLFKIFPK
jgi:tRNA pseudouridine38-40 synthase